MVFYYGTDRNINGYFDPVYREISGRRAVYGTQSRTHALLYIAKWGSLDLDLIKAPNGILLIEKYYGAFNRLKSSGFLYTFSDDGFKYYGEERIPYNFNISEIRKEIIHKEYIKNVLSELTKCRDIQLITFDQKMAEEYRKCL